MQGNWTREAADQLGYDTGYGDAMAGKEYDAYNDQVPPELDVFYRDCYRSGYYYGSHDRKHDADNPGE